MSLYRRYAQGEPDKSNFVLSIDNIDRYLKYAEDLHQEIIGINQMTDLQYKLEHIAELDDELYTEEYIRRRIEKLSPNIQHIDLCNIQQIKADLLTVNKEIEQVRPLVFDKIEGQKESNHIKMSELDDRRKELEDKIDEFYGSRYAELKKNLKKIYYMIIDGVDISTVQSCFMQMKQVLLNKITTEEAVGALMDESSTKYNLPSTIWDPIRSKVKGRGKGRKK